MLNTMQWTVTSLEDTAAVAQEVLSLLTAGSQARVIALHGDLGTGKTAFVQQLAALLGVRESVTSPTFVIMKTYPLEQQTFVELVHIDAYRIETPAEMQPLKLEQLLAEPRTLVCIEWAERITELLPEDAVHLTFTINGEQRIIMHTDHG